MKSSKTINLAILGLGKIAHKFAKDVSLVEGVTLVAVASRNLDKAKQFAAEYDVSNYYDSYKELATSPDVSLIYIATPNNFHFEHATLCIEAGKAVICEKPLALNTTQVSKMIAKANQKKLFLMEAMWTRFIPATQKVIDIIADGTIGNITRINADFGFAAATDLDSRLYSKKLGGGSLLDIGIYPIYLSYLLLGMPNHIKATATLSSTGVDSNCEVLFKYANAECKLESSFTKTTPTEALIVGTKGNIRMHSRFHHCKEISVITENKDPITVTVDYQGNGYGYELAHVRDCIREGKAESSLVSHTDSLNLIGLLDKVRELIGVKFEQDAV